MKRLHLITLAVIALLTLASMSALAATGTISSTVTIECAADVAGTHSLDFGLLAAPTNGSADVWVISELTGTLVNIGSGNGIDFISDDHARGSFTITGSEAISYSVAVTNDFADAFLTLSDPTVDPASPLDPSPGTHECMTSSPISVGGTLTVLEGAATGSHTDAVITITANY